MYSSGEGAWDQSELANQCLNIHMLLKQFGLSRDRFSENTSLIPSYEKSWLAMTASDVKIPVNIHVVDHSRTLTESTILQKCPFLLIMFFITAK